MDDITFWEPRNITTNFFSIPECGIKQYKIDRIVDEQLKLKIWNPDEYATVTKDGMFEIRYFSSKTKPLSIYVSGSTSDASNTTMWSEAIVPVSMLTIDL